MALKCIIFDLDDTLISPDGDLVDGIDTLIDYIGEWQIHFVVVSNRPKLTGRKKLLAAGLAPDLFVTQEETGKKKGSPRYVGYPCEELNLETNEVIYVGHSKLDMWTASHARVIFVNAQWAPQYTDYGILLNSPEDLAYFISHYLLKNHLWYWTLDTVDLIGRRVTVHALIDGNGAGEPALKSHMITVLKRRGDVTLNGASFKIHVLSHLLGSIYLIGLHREVDFWAVYPGHEKGSGNLVLGPFIDIAAKLFRERYIPDLIERHTTAEKSSYKRAAGGVTKFTNQANTIRLNPDHRSKIANKKLLVVDDFTTEGYSFECARNILYEAGAEEVICVAAGKYGKSYRIETRNPSLSWNPFQPNTFETTDFKSLMATGAVNDQALEEFKSSYARIGSI